MSLKPNAQNWTIKEQIFEDVVSGLTFQFEIVDDIAAPFRLKIYGESLEFGNRDILFDQEGKQCGSGTSTSGLCKPAWLTDIDKLTEPDKVKISMIDQIYDEVNLLMQSGHLEILDDKIAEIDVDNTPIDELLAYLTVTLPVKSQLSARPTLFDETVRTLIDREEYDPLLLKGLE